MPVGGNDECGSSVADLFAPFGAQVLGVFSSVQRSKCPSDVATGERGVACAYGVWVAGRRGGMLALGGSTSEDWCWASFKVQKHGLQVLHR